MDRPKPSPAATHAEVLSGETKRWVQLCVAAFADGVTASRKRKSDGSATLCHKVFNINQRCAETLIGETKAWVQLSDVFQRVVTKPLNARATRRRTRYFDSFSGSGVHFADVSRNIAERWMLIFGRY